MKKRLLAFLLIFVMALSFAVPALAVGGTFENPEVIEGGEETQIFWRTMNGVLQYRVWSITYGYWLTDWINF